MARQTILLVDDEDTLRDNLARVLTEEGYEVVARADGSSALRELKTTAFDAIITDLRMPGLSGMELIDHAVKLVPTAPIIVITAFGEVETAVSVMKKGAQDYICKPVIFDELIFKLKRLLAHQDLTQENRLLREQVNSAYDSSAIVTHSASMKAIMDAAERVAQTASNVLICGESGTGKEMLARCLHSKGARKDRPFIAVNCGGLVDGLVESEFFGYRRGAFTGAESDRQGYFEAADGGTLFLDEIGNLPFVSQAILLRAIEEKAIARVGDNRPRPVDIRIIAATNRALEPAVEAGEFREDLFFRLNVVRITMPPLRERPDDIPPLVEHFVRRFNIELKTDCPGFDRDAMDNLLQQRWRGNVRELQNVVERALIFAGNRPVGLQDLCSPGSEDAVKTKEAPVNLRSACRDFERRHIVKVLAQCDHDKLAAAEALGIGLSSLYRKMDELGIAKAPTELSELS